ncbi:hypothetical protein K388_06948 [Streptomyces sp. KhCrAH-43]|uniref:hypothetical protein n=1 Tax=unclassified Streptomyces TaxID=2593676 RepID=UPI00036E4D44|nr:MULTISPECIES: hypothetical protein [unclassified Streptomyces]MYS32939.1 hypothetical protein [Streptomyces sp. SID4920]MYX64270.1 hypothetical protein [Streptomyces sp. SID8373]RAJ48682.1 hypothetical protein K388_06948 [Streptomyces sp. KhCrAH-43]
MSGPVPHRFVLNLFHLLRRIEPAAAVVGTTEIVRIGGLVFTLSLARTIVHEEYKGFYLTATSPTAGELGSTLLTFTEYKVTTGTGASQRQLDRLNQHNVDRLINGVFTAELETAVAAFTAAYAG